MKRIISRLLFIVIFIECVAANNTLALGAEIGNISLFEMEVKKIDENISSGAVYIESAIIDNEYDSIDDYVQSILDSNVYYNGLTEGEKVTLRQNLGIREDTMTALCDNGYTIEDSVKKAVIMQQLNISVRDVLSMIEAYGSEEKASQEALKYRRSQYDYTEFYDEATEADMVALMIKGYEFEKAVNICVVKNCLILADDIESGTGLTVIDIAVSDSAVSVSYKGLNDMAEMYSVNKAVLKDMLSKANMTVDELEIKVIEYKAEHKMLPQISMMAASSSSNSEDDVFSRFTADPRLNSAPFTKDKNVLDSVSICSGALTYTDKVTTIPGINGMDFDLNLIYNSDDRISEDDRNGTMVWGFNIPKFVSHDDGDGSYLQLPDGNKYEIEYQGNISGNGTYHFVTDYYNDMTFVRDENGSIADSRYILSFKDGKKVYFDSNWKAIRIEDRFGNYINIDQGFIEGMVTIESSSGIKVISSFNNTILPSVMTVKVYNGNTVIKTITYNLGSFHPSNNVNNREAWYIKSKTDEMGKITTFNYSISRNYVIGNKKFHSVNLTEINFPTGLTAKYTYGKGIYVDWKTVDKPGNFGTSTYKEREYDRISDISYYENNKYLYGAQYSYSDHNYMCYVDQDKDEKYDRNYEYYVIKNENGKCTRYNFNNKNQLAGEVIGCYNNKGNWENVQGTSYYYGERKKIFDQYYASSDVPVWVTVTRGRSKYTYYYDYDSAKNLTGYWGPSTTANKYTLRDRDELHKVSYTYGSYSQLLTKSYKQSDNVTVTEKNTLTNDKKNIASTVVYTTSESSPLSKTTYTYDAKGNVLNVGNYKSNTVPVYTYNTYDSKGQYVTQVKKNNIINKMEYDPMGNITKTTDGNGNVVKYTYDVYNNLTKTDYGSSNTRAVYDYGGNNVTVYDENNKAKFYDYNGIGQLVSVKDVTTNKILASYTYDTGNLLMKTATIGEKSKLEIVYNILN